MKKSRLPPVPDFNSIDEMSATTSGSRTQILSLIGNLVFTWSNNESMFIYFLVVLLKTDFSTAAITFVSLNTTRARLDLVRRLAKEKVKDEKMLRRVERLIERFNVCTKVRNEFNHCIYSLNDAGEFTHTTILRVTEKKNGIEFAQARDFDERRVEEMVRTIRKLTILNRDLWSFLPEFEAHLADTSGATSAPTVDAASTKSKRD